MSAIKQSDDDRLQPFLARVSQVQQSSAVGRLTNGNNPSAVNSTDSAAPVGADLASTDFSHGQPTTESMNDFLREVDSLFTSSAEDHTTPRDQSPRSDASEYAASTPAESVAQSVLTPPIAPNRAKTTTGTTLGVMREAFHFRVSRIWVDVGIAAAALILGVAIGHSTQKADGSSTVTFRPQQSSAVQPVFTHSQQPAATISPSGNAKGRPVLISDLQYMSTSDTTNVQISLEDGVRYDVHRISNPDRVYVDLWKAHVAPELLGKRVPVSETFVSRVRIAQREPDTVRVTLETKGACDYSARILPHPYRLVITLSGQLPKKG